jgi:hypothetical protein
LLIGHEAETKDRVLPDPIEVEPMEVEITVAAPETREEA